MHAQNPSFRRAAAQEAPIPAFPQRREGAIPALASKTSNRMTKPVRTAFFWPLPPLGEGWDGGCQRCTPSF